MEILKKTIYRLLMYLAGGITISIVFCPVCFWDELQNNYHVVRYYSFLFILLWEVTRWISQAIDKKIDWIERPLAKSLHMLWAHIFILAPLNFIFVFIAFEIIGPSPPTEAGNPSPHYLYFLPMQHTLVGLFIAFFRNSRNFLLAWKKSVARVQKLERKQVEYQLQALKNQVNPHFLFNNLNTLTSLIHQSPQTAEQFAEQLARVYRYLLEEKEHGLIPIEREMDFLESYIYLLKIRFTNNLQIDWMETQLTRFHIAPFTLQLLLENAIKHNIVSSEMPLQIRIYQEEDYLVIQNNIQRKKQIDYSSGMGLKNIISRYSLLTENPVDIQENKYFFTVKLPLISSPQ